MHATAMDAPPVARLVPSFFLRGLTASGVAERSAGADPAASDGAGLAEVAADPAVVAEMA